ncbi:MAG TPA: hypothetical protein PK771_05465 [Spirochaetota bacterium]|nr:hypothetical protein [Spirochaetota bacterium]
MNFLSHFYLHKTDNLFYNIGLTIPDVLSLHNRRFRVTETYLLQKKSIEKSDKINLLLDGMLIHLKVDNIFHNSNFFHNSHLLMSKLYFDYKINPEMPYYIFHILLEILIDRFLLINRNPNLADEFYKEYKNFNFSEISDLFEDNNNYNKIEFIKLSNLIANSSFLNDYIYNEMIIDALNKISLKIGKPLNLNTKEILLLKYIAEISGVLENSISLFVDNFTVD